jgi:hypothetical protein
MFRKLLIAVAVLAASACSYGSAVDIAPMKDRLAHPLVPPGDYCGAKGAQGAYMISTGDDCGKLVWNGARRSIDVIDQDKPKDTMSFAIVDMGGGLYATQYESNDPAGRPDPHQLNLVIASGNAFTSIGVLDGDELDAVFKRHPKVKIGQVKDKDDYIAAGDVSEIKAFLRDAGGESLKADRAKGDEVEVMVLDKRNKAEHPASKAQIRDIEAVKAIAASLTPK